MSAQKSSGKGASTKKSGSSKGRAGASPQTRPINAGNHASRPAQPRAVSKDPALDRSTRNDLVGVAIAALAVVLVVVVCMPGDAIVTSWLSRILHLGLGLGAYILPFAMLIWAVSFFLEDSLDIHVGRGAAGVLMIFVALLSLFSVNTVGAAADPSLLFVPTNLMTTGGYLGAAIAWVLLRFFGPIVAIIALVALIVGGLVVIGFSISKLFGYLVALFQRTDEGADGGEDEENAGLYARARIQRFRPVAEASGAGKTSVLPGADADVTQIMASDDMNRTAVLDDGFDSDGEMADTPPRRSTRFTPLVSARDIAASVDRSRKGSTHRNVSPSQRRSLSRRRDDDASIPAVGLPFDGDMRAIAGERLMSGDDIARAAENAGRGNEPQDLTDADDGKTRAEEEAVACATVPATKRSSHSGSSHASKSTGKTVASSAPASNSAPALDGSPVARALADAFGADKFAGYVPPSTGILKRSAAQGNTRATQLELRTCAERLQSALDEFKVDAKVVGWIHGPTVTAYKIELAPGVRINTLTKLSADIALSLASSAVRIMSIPGTSLVGIEVPNQTRANVLLGDVLGAEGAPEGVPLLMGVGKNVEGEAVSADLAEMPHLLIGGTTGSGKSVAINSMIMSILMNSTPSQVRMILIDPKRVELSLYNDIPNLYVPVVTDAEKAASALAWATIEMDRRLKLFEKLGVRNIKQYKRLREDKIEEYTKAAEKAEERARKAGADEEGVEVAIAEVMPDEDGQLQNLPYIVIVIDELADLMMVASKDVETSISRLAAVARAAGICLIIATQRPSTNIITGVIKANITNRIAFNVASGTDSRVILDSVGAEKLIGHGDMLFSRPEYGKPMRVQGCFVSEKEIKQVVADMKSQGEPEYHDEVFATRVGGGTGLAIASDDSSSSDDPLVWEAAEIVVSGGMGSTSTLQRRLSVGYARAGRIMDALENKGIVGPPNGSKPREVLVDVLELEGIKALEMNDD